MPNYPRRESTMVSCERYDDKVICSANHLANNFATLRVPAKDTTVFATRQK